MNGERALIYSRVRENQLNPAENDLTRGARQQAVTQAVHVEVALAVDARLELPFDGSSLVKPLTTDLSADAAARARLGRSSARRARAPSTAAWAATPASAARRAAPTEDNRATIAMLLGLSAPQPPTSTYGPGCQIGHPLTSGDLSRSAHAGVARGRLPPPAYRREPRRRRSTRIRRGLDRARAGRRSTPDPLAFAALAAAAPVVGRVEPRSLVVHGDRVEHALERRAPQTSQRSGLRSFIPWKTSSRWPLGQRYS